jgi:hypothetical protein
MPRIALFSLLILVGTGSAAEPDFNRDIRPILSNHCYKCHGPATQKGGLRLDSELAATKKGAVVPGKVEESELIARVILAADDEARMPPADSPQLSAKQIQLLKDWVKAGGKYSPHWAFVPPKQANLESPAKHPVDRFILEKLKQAKLTPSGEAEKSTLIRRVTLDLTGLLPTPKEVDEFVKDNSPEAYEKLVDRLLASPHYGERQGRHWLDLARYADSNGYTIDGARSIWPYRDWVIRAFNEDKPFDQFTIEQLAGDLLPKPTKEQLIATGFHRNTSFNEEGGTDPEQFRVERVIDRTNTTGAVWLGLTVNCAQCHDHKYDPFSQQDYFKLYAFFNSSDEPTMALAAAPELEKQIADLTAKLADLRRTGMDEAVKKVEAELKKVSGKVPTTLIIRERKAPRETHIQIRGDFLRKGGLVNAGYPNVLEAKPESKVDVKRTRLDLAKWLVSAENPLTARVVVNRAWQQFFGSGLVETENDFGMQGSLPTHPELLDWLAVEFRKQGWSMKKLHRLIVTSNTYKQASKLRSDVWQVDPQNKLLARQNRIRLEAEIIRDAALSSSGLLNPKLGGPGVYPPLPAEVFSFTQNKKAWPESQGPDRYRRGVYTYIWRQSQHHLITTFDGADAQTACTRRGRSNTPLQALHLANDPAFVEFADALGKRVLKDGPADDAGRVKLAFQLAFSRNPSTEEEARLVKFLQGQKDAALAWKLAARVLLNLDEFITRE